MNDWSFHLWENKGSPCAISQEENQVERDCASRPIEEVLTCVRAYLWGMCCVRSWWNSERGERSCLHSGPASQEEWCCSLLHSGTWWSLLLRSDLHEHNSSQHPKRENIVFGSSVQTNCIVMFSVFPDGNNFHKKDYKTTMSWFANCVFKAWYRLFCTLFIFTPKVYLLWSKSVDEFVDLCLFPVV